ncbi:MAG: hypothetical protein HY729_05700 [Candidatus Rokubacteria bacterium]|nr:hypothetical protein [Candidatus Rokubacteria bacterium]
MDWVSELWRDYCIGEQALWRQGSFWLVVAALVLPLGWLLLASRLQPVRICARYVRRDS